MLTYRLKCNNNTKNIGSKKVTMTNKVIRQKSRFPNFMPEKSRFLKQKHKKNVVGNINPSHYKAC